MDVTFYVLASIDPQVRLLTACRLIEKAWRGKHQVYVQAASRAEAEALDEMLWAFKPESFIPHHLVGDGPTPPPAVRLGHGPLAADARDLLLNLADDIPSGFERFRRILEIVGGDDQQRGPARQHWRFYKQQGYPVQSHNL